MMMSMLKREIFGESCGQVEMFATKTVTSARYTRLCRSNGIQSTTRHSKSLRQNPKSKST